MAKAAQSRARVGTVMKSIQKRKGLVAEKSARGTGVKFRVETYATVTNFSPGTRIKYVPNPKNRGSKSFTRYAGYEKAKTVGEALKFGSKREDLLWELERGYYKVSGASDEWTPFFQARDAAQAWRAARVEKCVALAKELGLRRETSDQIFAMGECADIRLQRRVCEAVSEKKLKAGKQITDADVSEVLHLWGFCENTGRLNVLPEGRRYVYSDTIGAIRRRTGTFGPTPPTKRYPNFAKLLCRWLSGSKLKLKSKFVCTAININGNYAGKRHRDQFNEGPSIIRAFGKFKGGKLYYWPKDIKKPSRQDVETLKEADRVEYDLAKNTYVFDGNRAHEVAPFEGERYSIVFFTGRGYSKVQVVFLCLETMAASVSDCNSFLSSEYYRSIHYDGAAPLVELVFLYIPLRWRFAPRAVCRDLRLALDAQAASTIGLLRPSMLGSSSPKNVVDGKNLDIANHAVRDVYEFNEPNNAAVTCVCFGQERLRKGYVVLAVASQHGHALIYHCRRNDAELALLEGSNDTAGEKTTVSSPSAKGNVDSVTLHLQLAGHTQQITSMKFNSVSEDQLITTSLDKTVRFWNIETGQTLIMFSDTCAVTVAVCLPFNPERFIVANSRGRLRLCSRRGFKLQAMLFEASHFITALAFDEAGVNLFAGTKGGKVMVFGVSDEVLDFQLEVNVGGHCIDCITFAPMTKGSPACLFVNTKDNSVKIAYCMYDHRKNKLLDLAMAHRRLVFAHTCAPLKSCYSSFGGGHFVSASEDNDVCIYSLAGAFNHRIQRLTCHTSPVVAVAVNDLNTLLVSADVQGRIVLWRRVYG